jgi:hypothetical protein
MRVEPRLIVGDEIPQRAVVDLPVAVLFGNVPKLQRSFRADRPNPPHSICRTT